MKCNVGEIDRIIRILLGANLLLIGYFSDISAGATFVLYALAFLMFITGIFRFCLFYLPFGINTCDPPTKQRLSSQ